MSKETEVDQSQRRIRARVRGVVQGVGFRPFVYRLAAEGSLAGWIGNDTEGVTIEIEGDSNAVATFLARLQSELPPMARLDEVILEEVEATREAGFRIVASEVHGAVSTGIPADTATCEDCLRELFDVKDRRYRYPFLNCTNCGPRFTITRQIPYDRPQTSMAAFTMCTACQAEYDNPGNRRFHAQPNACPVCGPHVWLARADGSEIPCEDPVLEAVELLAAGGVLAIKGIGGFHLSVDACNEDAVKMLRERKRRYGKPLATMVRDLERARDLCVLTAEEESLLTSAARPIVLARARDGNGIASSVAPGLPWLGVFIAYSPLHHLLLSDERLRALVMTSANLSDEPIAIDNDDARERLGAIADAFVMHDRAILQRCDDSVMAIVDGAPQVLRRARGYVPLGIELPMDAPPLLAVGGHLKNVFALTHGRFTYQSQHLGDLENLAGLLFFQESLEHWMRTFEIAPEAVVHDLHPGYLSTTWAKQWADARKLPRIGVQHHHAHIVACMAEHWLAGPVIGLALDGTGYGTDGRIWGGEALICRYESFERVAHLETVPMPGGDAAVKQPWRMAYAHLRSAGVDAEEAAELAGASEQEARVVERMMARGVNAPLTSSLGRLFDAVAAVVLDRRMVDYDAQAAIELEGLVIDEPDSEPPAEYILKLKDGVNGLALLSTSLWRAVMQDLRGGVSKALIGARFHAGVARGFIDTALRARSAFGISQVALSGGCMHNRLLLRLLREGLEREGFSVYTHRKVSPGDGGLSYGQAAVAAARLRAGI
jgi:hydrogenase maturation protein HypF